MSRNRTSKRSKISSTENSNMRDNAEVELCFTNELKGLMYGFGDKETPNNESAELLQEYVIEYVQNIALAAYRRNKRKGSNEISFRDLVYVLRKDKKRFYRIPSLKSFYDFAKKTKNIDNIQKTYSNIGITE